MANSNQLPPSYSQSTKNSSQTGYGNYPQSFPITPTDYPTQQGYAASAGYDPSKTAYPTQGYYPGGGYTNYGQQPYYPPPPPPPAASNNNQTVVVTQNTQNVVVEPFRNYMALSVLAMLLFLPTGIMAILKSNEAQNQYRMGNIDRAQVYNMEARKFIKISVAVGVVLIILAIVIPVVLNIYVFNTYYRYNYYDDYNY